MPFTATESEGNKIAIKAKAAAKGIIQCTNRPPIYVNYTKTIALNFRKNQFIVLCFSLAKKGGTVQW